MRQVTVAPKGMGLNDFVAQQEGFFQAEGLDVTLDWKTFRGTQSSWKGLNYLERPQDRPYTKDNAEVIQGACVWGSICNALGRHGQVRAGGLRRFALGDLRAAGFQDPRAEGPEGRSDLGRHARRQPLQRALPAGKISAAENIKTVNTGGFGARLKALLDGEVEAASLLPPQIAMAEQLGLRKIIEDKFHTLWWVPAGFDPDVTKSYLRALDRAEKAMDADLAKYLPLWKLAVPAEFETYHKWDFSQFGRGERFVYKTIPQTEFDEVMDQVKRWDLDQFLKDKSYEGLAAR